MKKLFTLVAAAFVALAMNAQDITCAAAVTAGNALEDNVTDSTAQVSVVGYVSITEAWKSNSQQQIFYMADDSASTSKAFEAYYCNTEVAVKRGDKVRVTGYLTKYVPSSGVAQVEIKNGNVEILQVAEEQAPKEIQLYTVSEVIAAYDNGTLIEGDSCKVVGVISKWYSKSSKFDQYHSVSYFITDGTNEFEMYNSYSLNNARYETYEYTDENTATCIDENGLELHIGDSVIGIGTVKKYNTTYEFNQNCYLVWTNAAAPVEEADVVFTSAEFNGQGTASTGSEVTATKDGVTFWTDKGFGDQYGVRCYKNGNVSITSAEQQIGKIVFEFYSTYTGELDTEIIVNGMEWTNVMAAQARMNKIKIYFGEYEQPQPEALDTISVAQAMEIGNALEAGTYTDKKYVVEGYAVSIKPYGEKYDGKQTFYMSDDATAERGDFTAFNCSVAAPGVEVGNFVRVTGKIQKYAYQSGDTVIEITGGDVEVVEGQGIENVVLTEKAQKVVVDGVIYIIRDNKMFDVRGTQVR